MSGNGQEKKFFKVREKSENLFLSPGKLTRVLRKSQGKWKLTHNTADQV